VNGAIPGEARAGLLLPVIASGVLAILTILATGGLLPGDEQVLALGRGLADGPVGAIAGILDTLGSFQVWVIVTLAVALMAMERGRRATLVVLGCVALAEATSLVLKHLADRARPPAAALQGLLDPGFPSGHTARVTALLVLVVAWWVPRGRWATIGVIVVIPALAMGIARVVVGEHYPSDVVGGWLVGVGATSLVLLAVSRIGGRGTSGAAR
jgi:undecaprenyl-diphosphatase